MARTLFACALALAILYAPTAAFSQAEDTTAAKIENYDKYVGRPLVFDNRAINADLIRTLPLACPPFHLKDEDGNIIDPTKDETGKPFDPAAPPQGIPQAVSAKQTCGTCHDYERITKGYHFQMGRDEMFDETGGIQRSPGFFGKWQLLYQRELAPKSFDNPDAVDMTPFEWIVSCGVCHPGGGPGEYDRAGQRYDKALKLDREVAMMGDGDYHDSPWEHTGVMEADCFICHLAEYEYSIRAQQIKKLNFKWAATAAAGLGYVWGSVADGQTPSVYYNKSKFMADGKVHLHIQRPGDRQCQFCHDISSVQKRGSTWHQHYQPDVHTEQGITCLKCHPGDIRHNFAKGSSSSQTVRDDTDNSMLSCKECHEQEELGAPDEHHEWLPALHLERISCEACHITNRAFVATGTVETIQGDWRQLPAQTDPDIYESWMFGAMWGRVGGLLADNLIEPFSPAELATAADLVVAADSPIRGKLVNALSEGAVSVRAEIERLGGLESENARALMLLALEQGMPPSDQPQHAVCVFRGTAYQYDLGGLQKLPSKLQPKRPGATIAVSPYAYARAKGDGVIHPEGYQLGVFWAYMDGDKANPLHLSDMKAAWNFLNSDEFDFYRYPGSVTTENGKQLSPAVPGNAEAPPATPAASEPELMLLAQAAAAPVAAANTAAVAPAPAEPAPAPAPADAAPAPAQPAPTPEAAPAPEPAEAAHAPKYDEAALQQEIAAKINQFVRNEERKLEIFDDNNDTFPEANSEEEIALIGWALTQVTPRIAGKDLYYIKGETIFKVTVAEWTNPYEAALFEMTPVPEGAPFLRIDRNEQKERPGANSWDAPMLAWVRAETRIAPAYDAKVEPVDPAAVPAIAQLAQRLPWTVSHGVEPAKMALGAKGCADCHSADSHFFFGPVTVDPFDVDGTPATKPMYALLGYTQADILIGAWRETVLKPLSPWVVLAVLVMIVLHFVIFGIKGGTPAGPPNVVRFRIHERMSHLIAMVTVVFLAITGFCFLLGKSDPMSHWARLWHTYFGYVASAGVTILVLVWFLSMLPARGDLKWLMKAGGYLGGVKGHLPAGKFNAGQKILFWLVLGAFGTLIVTGLVMGLKRDAHFPGQELLYTIHDVAALGMIVLLMAHIYLATIVVPHSLRSLFGGKVSHIWAHEHHANWKHPKPVDAEASHD